ncbi:MAG: DAK2 domain-containing protein [Anaerolineaceae bacterium]|nr:DAK2 domain-containing protein [Anaerolineaceae bacterium]
MNGTERMMAGPDRRTCDGRQLRWLFAAGLAWLEQNQALVDSLNVFPVPDGDTGKNMALTLRSANEHLKSGTTRQAGEVGAMVARGALMGARGNSGVILSQLLAGFADSIRGIQHFDAQQLNHAWRAAVDKAYRAVTEPVEGTILTVARETGVALAQSVQDEGEEDLVVLLETMVAAAQVSLLHTPELLPVLRKAGVVDSGGQGLVCILEGMLRMAQGQPVLATEASTSRDEQGWQHALEPEDEEGYGYDVQFLMHGESMDVKTIHDGIDALGWSTLVVGDERLIKVHVHVHDPGQPISYAIDHCGWLNDVVVENMQEQYLQYLEQRMDGDEDEEVTEAGEVGVIAVAAGAGLTHLFREELGAAEVIAGGQTMNPSARDFVDAMERLPQKAFVLLPNNSNIILAAQQAADLADGRDVRVVPSRSIPQGIEAMLHRPMNLQELESGVAAMKAALGEVVSASLTTATRDAGIDGLAVSAGQYIGLVDGCLCVASDALEDALVELVQKALHNDGELVTLYYGEQVDSQRAEALASSLEESLEDVEVELVRGDQPLYPFLASVE